MAQLAKQHPHNMDAPNTIKTMASIFGTLLSSQRPHTHQHRPHGRPRGCKTVVAVAIQRRADFSLSTSVIRGGDRDPKKLAGPYGPVCQPSGCADPRASPALRLQSARRDRPPCGVRVSCRADVVNTMTGAPVTSNPCWGNPIRAVGPPPQGTSCPAAALRTGHAAAGLRP